MGTRWTTPASNSPVYNSIKMYRNYDGKKSTFGDTSVSASGTNPDNVAAFAAQRTTDGALTIMVVTKYLSGTAPVVINATNFAGNGIAQVWQLNASNSIVRLPDANYTNGSISASLVAPSITLFVIPTRPLRLQSGPARSDGQFELWFNGETGGTYVLQSSTDLTSWNSINTNTLTNTQLHLVIPLPGLSQAFFRGLGVP
jgi:hypothetical protein